MSDKLQSPEELAKQLINQWHYAHYEDFIPNEKSIEGVMFGDLARLFGNFIIRDRETFRKRCAEVANKTLREVSFRKTDNSEYWHNEGRNWASREIAKAIEELEIL